NAEYFRFNQYYQFQKAIYDTEKYGYEEALAHKESDVEKRRTQLAETEKKMNDYKAQVEKLTLDQRAAQAELGNLTKMRDDAQKGIDDLLGEYNRARLRRTALDPGLI